MPPSQSEASLSDSMTVLRDIRCGRQRGLIGTLGYYLLHGPVGLIWGYAYL